ncbi:MAG: DNA-binding response regulator [Burkholderiaceae bacterium]|jgi:DNA-binding response OmpR family regulator|nr:DNA-binding response regulator [Burkholderiaceae bacterium]
MQRLLMIDDDARLAAMVRDYLAASGFVVDIAGDVASGVVAVRSASVDLLILDLMLPDGDGLDLCRRLRATGVDVPILMLTAKGDPIDRVIGLEIGADDYLPKPFEPRELLARVKALLRRSQGPSASQGLRFGRLEIDRDARVVRVDGQMRALTSHQFDLLVALAERAGRVLTREQLMDLARGEVFEAFDRSVDVHIARIRAAIEDDPRHPKRIITVRGAGYVFARAQEAA